MGSERLLAFSDGVIAIIITIMVLEMRPPEDATLAGLTAVLPVFLSYVLSFVNVGIYWNNHHHLMQTCSRVTGGILWANLHLLFWLSLFPFATAWMGEHHFAPTPTAIYGVVLLLAALSYRILVWNLRRTQGGDSILSRAIGADRKGRLSEVAYLLAIPLAFVSPWISGALYVGVALAWLIPDRRIERVLGEAGATE